MSAKLRRSTYVFEGGVGGSAGSCFLQELVPVEVCVLNAGALICSKRKKKKRKQRKKSSLKHSQRRQKLCQRVEGENSNQYKLQHKGKQKACFKDLCLSSLIDSYVFSRLWDFSSQHSETRNDSDFTAMGEQTSHTATGTCPLLFCI